MDQLERLTNLLALLLETRVPLTMEQLTRELDDYYPAGESARRTAFERDKALLRSEGVPIRQQVLAGSDAGRTAYWVERSEYELGDLGLDDDERRALQLAVATVHLGASWAEEALWKLERPEDDRSVGPSALSAALPVSPSLPMFHRGVTERREVTFSYRGKRRTLHPYGLLARDGFWYVVGHDIDAAEQRTYRLDRVEGSVKVGTAGAFERPEGFRATEAFPADPKQIDDGSDGGPTHAEVLVDAVRARSVVDELGAEAVRERRPDGSVVVIVPCANLAAFRSWVVGFLEHAEVLGPPAARADIVRWLTSVGTSGGSR